MSVKGSTRIDLGQIVSVISVDRRFLAAYDLVVRLESGDVYQVGAPQSLTRLLHHIGGIRSRDNTPLLRSDFDRLTHSQLVTEIIDAGALAPTNMTMSRLATFADLHPNGRARYRYDVMRMIDPSIHLDFKSDLGRLQFAATTLVSSPILDRDKHRSSWVNFSSSDFSNQSKWEPLKVCVRLTNGVKAELLL